MIPANWSGLLVVGTRSFRVKTFGANKDLSERFVALHRACRSPLVHNTTKRCARCNVVVKPEDASEGLPTEDGRYALVTRAEVAARAAPTRGITVEGYALLDTLDSSRLGTHLWIAPDSASFEAFALFRDALMLAERTALCHVALKSNWRPYRAMLWARENLLMMARLRVGAEIVTASELTSQMRAPTEPTPDPIEVRALIAEMQARTTALDPRALKDEYAKIAAATAADRAEVLPMPDAEVIPLSR